MSVKRSTMIALNMKRRNEELVISRPQDVSFGTIRMQLLLSSALIFLIGGGERTIQMILRYCGQQQWVRFKIKIKIKNLYDKLGKDDTCLKLKMDEVQERNN